MHLSPTSKLGYLSFKNIFNMLTNIDSPLRSAGACTILCKRRLNKSSMRAPASSLT